MEKENRERTYSGVTQREKEELLPSQTIRAQDSSPLFSLAFFLALLTLCGLIWKATLILLSR